MKFWYWILVVGSYANAEFNPVFEELWSRAKPLKTSVYEGPPDFTDHGFSNGNQDFVDPKWTAGPPKFRTTQYGPADPKPTFSRRPQYVPKPETFGWSYDNIHPPKNNIIQYPLLTETIPHITPTAEGPTTTTIIPTTESTTTTTMIPTTESTTTTTMIPTTETTTSTTSEPTTTSEPPVTEPPEDVSPIGGEQANPMEFCHMVRIIYWNNDDKIHSECAGSIINEEYVLSAAHCLRGKDPAFYKVYAGKFNRDVTIMEPGETRHKGLRVVRHPLYKSGGCDANDIGLLRVHPPFQFNQFIQPVILNHPSYNLDSLVDPVAVGWGLKSIEPRVYPEFMFKVTMPIVDENTCRGIYNASKGTCIQKGVICAGGNGRDTCDGDSGGPLMSGTVQIGVISKGTKYCSTRDPAPSTHMDVAFYRDWIDKTIAQTKSTSNYFFERVYNNALREISATNFSVAVNVHSNLRSSV